MTTPTQHVRVALLGPLEVEVGDAGVDVPGGQQRRLLVALATAVGSVVSTDRLVATLWGEDPPRSAVNSLQSHVARLRRTLGDPELVVRRGNGYALALDPEAVDASTFAGLVAAADRCDEPTDRRALLDRALRAWRAPEPAAVVEAGLVEDAVRLAQHRLAALVARAAAAAALGDTAAAEDDLRLVLAEDPFREPAVALLLRVLAADGRVAEADEAFQRLRHGLAEEHGLDPSPALEEVHRRLLRGELSDPPEGPGPGPGPGVDGGHADVRAAAGSPRPPPPRPSSSFHGRDGLLADVTSRLRVARCTTLVGPGGVGKTRLATEAVHALPSEVVWADLVDARDLGAVLGRVAVAAGRGTPGGLADVGQLAEGLAGRLLVLDNCEQVVEAVAGLVTALAPVRDLHVLATSRTPLQVADEQVVRLPPLPTGEPDGPALHLFLDRTAGAVDATDAAQRAVAREVVDRLDGLPLALELAARQVHNLGLEAVRDRLHDRLDLLHVDRTTGHPSHGDLRELVRWSTDQLAPTDGRALRLLGMFSGPFGLRDAERLLAASGIGSRHAAAVLGRLVEASLVVRARDATFRLLETVRACVLEDLAEHGDRTAAHEAHAAAVLAAAEEAADRYASADEADGLAALHGLVPDLQALAGRLADRGDVRGLARLTGLLHVYAYHTQRTDLLAAAGVLAELLDAAGGEDLPEDLAAAAWAAGALEASARGATDRALALADRAIDRGPTSPGAVRAWEVRGDVLLAQGDGAALDAYERMLGAAGAVGDPALEASAWVGIALAGAYRGDHAASRRAASEVEVRAHVLGVPSLRAWAAYARGEAEAALDPDAATAAFADAVRIGRAVDNHLVLWAASTASAVVRAGHGDPGPALAQLRGTIEGWDEAGTVDVREAVLRNLGVLLARVGHDEPAAVLLGRSVTEQLYEADRARVERALRATTERLGAPVAAQLQQQGRRMDLPTVVAYALAATDGVAAT